MKNNLRFCESLGMNGWESERDPVPGKKARPSVNIWPMGVSDTSGTLEFIEANGNPGAGRFDGLGNDRTDFKKLPVTTLDIFAEERGWFESEPEIAILKVDVEGHEGHVLLGAEKLLRAKIVQNIFMEVWLDEPETRNGKVRALELLIEAGYKLNGQGGWLGPGKHSLWPDDENLAKNIFASLEKENWPSRNLWWTL
jgi:FkbM family methyltransferase